MGFSKISLFILDIHFRLTNIKLNVKYIAQCPISCISSYIAMSSKQLGLPVTQSLF